MNYSIEMMIIKKPVKNFNSEIFFSKLKTNVSRMIKENEQMNLLKCLIKKWGRTN